MTSVPSPALVCIVNGGSGISSPKPTLTYAGNGAFTISNFDAVLAYTVTGSGTLTGSVLQVTVATGNATIFGTTPKGVAGVSTVAYRQAYTTYFVQTGDPYVTYSGDGSNGGTYYGTDQWNPNDGSAAGYYAVITPGYQAPTDYSGSGFTYSSTYNEWWKIV